MQTESNDGTPDAVRQIPKLASRYAHNRTLPVLVNLGLFLLACGAITGSSTLAGLEGRAGHKIAAWAFAALSLAVCVVWVWLVVTPRLGRIVGALSARLYGAEGTAVAAAEPRRRSRADLAVAVALGLCVTLQVLAGFVFETTLRYMVPIMAAYGIPFLLYVWVRQGGTAWPFMLLWPGLLAVHAVLALAGVYPFSGEPDWVTVLMPTIGYGAIAALASHLYSRVTLRRLRSLARNGESADTGSERHA